MRDSVSKDELSKDVQIRRLGLGIATGPRLNMFETRSCDFVSLNIIELSVLLKILDPMYIIVIYLAIK